MDALRAETLPAGLKRALLVSVAVHVGLIVALVISSTWAERHRPARSVLTTKLVRLGKERPKDLLPRKAVPPPPPEKPAPALTPKDTPAAPSSLPTAKDRIKQLSQVSSALDRLKQKAVEEEPEGSPEGVADGEVSDAKLAVLGNLFVTEVLKCLKQHWSIEGVEPARVRGLKATIALRVDASGKLLDESIEKSSGMAAFDRAVTQAVRRCGKVSPPPAELREVVRKDGFEVEFTP